MELGWQGQEIKGESKVVLGRGKQAGQSVATANKKGGGEDLKCEWVRDIKILIREGAVWPIRWVHGVTFCGWFLVITRVFKLSDQSESKNFFLSDQSILDEVVLVYESIPRI